MTTIWEGGVEVVAPVLVVPVTGGGPGQVQVQVQAVTERDPHVEEQQTSGNPLKVTSLAACFTQTELVVIVRVFQMFI